MANDDNDIETFACENDDGVNEYFLNEQARKPQSYIGSKLCRSIQGVTDQCRVWRYHLQPDSFCRKLTIIDDGDDGDDDGKDNDDDNVGDDDYWQIPEVGQS